MEARHPRHQHENDIDRQDGSVAGQVQKRKHVARIDALPDDLREVFAVAQLEGIHDPLIDGRHEDTEERAARGADDEIHSLCVGRFRVDSIHETTVSVEIVDHAGLIGRLHAAARQHEGHMSFLGGRRG